MTSVTRSRRDAELTLVCVREPSHPGPRDRIGEAVCA